MAEHAPDRMNAISIAMWFTIFFRVTFITLMDEFSAQCISSEIFKTGREPEVYHQSPSLVFCVNISRWYPINMTQYL